MRAALILLGALCVPALSHSLFEQWKVRHGRTYTADEEPLRAAIFAANVERINAHNMKGEPWTAGINEFTDLTSTEFAVGRIGVLLMRNVRRHHHGEEPAPGADPAPSWDWNAKGAVTPVKNQGQCGSCWAFSATGSIEGAEFVYKQSLQSLSEQQLVDCSSSYGNQGCNGGLMDNAFEYVAANGGLCSESSYPYKAVDGTCQSSTCSSVSVSGVQHYTDVTPNSDASLVAAVYQQPVSVAIEADQSSFQMYSGGVLTAPCGSRLDHGVLAVGWGTLNGVQYWQVKNSWGASWGMSGYVLIARGQQYNGGAGQCGIYSMSSYPTY